jgi:hypothetical protein
MKRNLYLIISAIAVIVLSYFIWVYPSLPRGINAYPLLNIKIDSNLDLLSIYPNKVKLYELMPDVNNIMSFTSSVNTNIAYNRNIEIHQFVSNREAIERYETSKRAFLDRKLYKEEGTNSNKYYITYMPTHLNYNHGIPIDIVTKSKVAVGFLKNNLFISINYSTLVHNESNYINEINEDIIYASKILQGVINNKPLIID